MEKNNPIISFVIPAYNEEKNIGRCLESVMNALSQYHATHENFSAEIIVANNASTDRTKEIAQTFPGVRVVDELRKGPTWARQAGLSSAQGNMLACVDADTILPSGWLSKVMTEFESDPSLMALSGPYTYLDSPWYVQFVATFFYFCGYLIDSLNSLILGRRSMLQGGNFVLRREAFEKIGGLDTSIEFWGDDTDLGRRVSQVGKVKWTFALPMYTSNRRFVSQGLLKTGALYALNFFSVTFFGRPANKKYVDVRI